jgi:hypothetical protein
MMFVNDKYEVGTNNCMTLGALFHYSFATVNKDIQHLDRLIDENRTRNLGNEKHNY